MQTHRVTATLESARLLSKLLRARSGKPRIAYFCHTPYFAGGESQLFRIATLAENFQFEPTVVFPSIFKGIEAEIYRRVAARGFPISFLPITVEIEPTTRKLNETAVFTIQRWLAQNEVALVHSVTLMREVGEAARRLHIAHVASLYQTNSHERAAFQHCDIIHSDSLEYASRWSRILNVPAIRIPSHVPEPYFRVKAAGQGQRTPLRIGLFGTFQPRKGQLEAIEAVRLFKRDFGPVLQLRLYGYEHFIPDYVAACKRMVEQHGTVDLVSFRGFVADPAQAMEDIDVVLCSSNNESLPNILMEAMAAGRLVIAPNVGGILEVVSQSTGIPMADNNPASICRAFASVLQLTPAEWKSKIHAAREVAWRECSKYSVATQLFRLYRAASDACAHT